MIYSSYWLKTELSSGKQHSYLFFWGHKIHALVTETCFSQWYSASFQQEGLTYPTAEHWMMAGKARLFDDHQVLHKILATTSPATAKKLGREVHNFDAARWDTAKIDLVVQGNVLKFSQHPELKMFLLNTGNQVLVEASPVDAIWGIGHTKDDPRAGNPFQWRGENLLGFALMTVRDLLRHLPQPQHLRLKPNTDFK